MRSASARLVVIVLLASACSPSGDGGGGASGWQRSAANPLLTPGISPSPSTTYEVSIADPSVLVDDTTGIWHAWYSATIFDTAISGDPGRIVIKHATSADGQTWVVQSTPVLSSRIAPGDWDYTHVETPSVVINPNANAPSSQRFLMFYSEDKPRLRHAMRSTPLREVRFRFDFEGTKVIAQ